MKKTYNAKAITVEVVNPPTKKQAKQKIKDINKTINFLYAKS